MSSEGLLLPPAARLVHIGPHKTGTTSLQRAFHLNREQLAPSGVHYAGAKEQPLLAALAVAGGGGMKGDRPPRPEDWTELLDEVRAAGDQRVVVSSEFLCYADDDAARRVVTEVPGGPVHVVVTLRSIARIAPSQWQQFVQNGNTVPYLEWLDGMFRRPPYDKPTPSFWRRHSHGELVRRWADVAGAENLTVVVADESDPGMLLHTFEALVGLPRGILAPGKTTNRSLNRGEAELVRLINTEFRQHDWSDPWTDGAHADLVRHGVVKRMKVDRRPRAGEPRLAMPGWAAERAEEVGAATVEAIRSLGVRVVGDLETLAEVPDDVRVDEDELSKPAILPGDAVALALLGAAYAGRKPTERSKVAAALAVIKAERRGRHAEDTLPTAAAAAFDALSVAEGKIDLSGLPPVRADVAASSVARVIEARGTGADLQEFPPTPTDAAWLAVLEAAKTPRSLSDKTEVAAAPPTDEGAVEAVATGDLLRMVARRSRARLRTMRDGSR